MNFERGTNIEDELGRIKEHQERVANISNQNKSIAQQFRDALTAGPVIKPLGISLGVMLFQQTTGINAIIFYTVSIFQTAGSTIESRYAHTPRLSSVHVGNCLKLLALVDPHHRFDE